MTNENSNIAYLLKYFSQEYCGPIPKKNKPAMHIIRFNYHLNRPTVKELFCAIVKDIQRGNFEEFINGHFAVAGSGEASIRPGLRFSELENIEPSDFFEKSKDLFLDNEFFPFFSTYCEPEEFQLLKGTKKPILIIYDGANLNDSIARFCFTEDHAGGLPRLYIAEKPGIVDNRGLNDLRISGILKSFLEEKISASVLETILKRESKNPEFAHIPLSSKPAGYAAENYK